MRCEAWQLIICKVLWGPSLKGAMQVPHVTVLKFACVGSASECSWWDMHYSHVRTKLLLRFSWGIRGGCDCIDVRKTIINKITYSMIWGMMHWTRTWDLGSNPLCYWPAAWPWASSPSLLPTLCLVYLNYKLFSFNAVSCNGYIYFLVWEGLYLNLLPLVTTAIRITSAYTGAGPDMLTVTRTGLTPCIMF